MTTKKQKPVLANMELKTISRLKELKRIINDGAEATETILTDVKQKTQEALTEAILTGNALLEAKQLIPRDRFARWCDENIKQKDKINFFKKIASRADRLDSQEKIYDALNNFHGDNVHPPEEKVQSQEATIGSA